MMHWWARRRTLRKVGKRRALRKTQVGYRR
nr:MAG TPA: hypothetical protein [Caudoviricetes sp.]